MKNKLFTLLFVLAASIGMMYAEVYSGKCGDNMTWSANTEEGLLTISGTGEMNFYGEFSTEEGLDYLPFPWEDESIGSLYYALGDSRWSRKHH